MSNNNRRNLQELFWLNTIMSTGVTNVRNKAKTFALIFVLGVMLPNLLIAAVSRHQTKEPVTLITAGTTEPKQTQPDELMIPVLDKNGIVRDISEDDYLTCVVLCEMPAEFEIEALKAQAIVARTYALRRQKTGSKHPSAAVCMEPSCCQGYKSVEAYLSAGGTSADVEKIRHAVVSTRNTVLTYKGELIEATYFSCSGGYTEDAQAVWGSDIPYLRATPSPGEEGAARYTDTVTFSTKEFLQKLGCTKPAGATGWLSDVEYTQGGGVASIRLCGKVFSGTTVRQLLGLRSTAFTITVLGDTVTVTTKGFGHRVGMSQYGADAMAANGSDYKEILQHYYQGIELVQYASDD